MEATELLYLVDSYLREFQAVVVKTEDGRVALDKTCFYPEGGGQPHDTGVLVYGGVEIPVLGVKRRGFIVWHTVNGSVPLGAEVTGRIDWERRYSHMRYHTAQHILSALFLDALNARTVGNQISVDGAHMDFELGQITNEDLSRIEEMANEWIRRDVEVKTYTLPREEAIKILNPERVRLDRLPRRLKELRIVEIPGLDLCACGGTHVKRTGELGKLRITRVKSKGRMRKRVEFTLGRGEE